jgi:hypothetical protein
METHFQEIRLVIAKLSRMRQNKAEGEAGMNGWLNYVVLLNVGNFLSRWTTVSFSINVFVVSVSYIGISIYVVTICHLR